jgi:hypothetical protein
MAVQIGLWRDLLRPAYVGGVSDTDMAVQIGLWRDLLRPACVGGVSDTDTAVQAVQEWRNGGEREITGGEMTDD